MPPRPWQSIHENSRRHQQARVTAAGPCVPPPHRHGRQIEAETATTLGAIPRFLKHPLNVKTCSSDITCCMSRCSTHLLVPSVSRKPPGYRAFLPAELNNEVGWGSFITISNVFHKPDLRREDSPHIFGLIIRRRWTMD